MDNPEETVQPADNGGKPTDERKPVPTGAAAPPAKPADEQKPEADAKPSQPPKQEDQAKPEEKLGSTKPGATRPGATRPGAARSGDEKKPASFEHMKDIVEFLGLAGQVINTVNLYGVDHKLSENALGHCYDYLVPLLEKCPRINLSISNREILVDGQETASKNPFIQMLANKLTELELLGFSLLKNMPRNEFEKLFKIIVTPIALIGDGDGFAEAVAQENLEFVQVEKVKYERVTEGDVVLTEGELEELGKEEGDGGDGDDMAPVIQQIVAFLKGDISVTAEDAADGLEELSSDADQLAKLIMEAVAVRQRAVAASGSGETLGDIVVGCLRRTFDGLMQHPSAKTQKGKKSIKKCLLMLEKNVLDKLHNLHGDVDEDIDVAISDAMEEMTDEFEVEALTTEYMKRRNALEKTEKRLLRYVKKQDEEDLEDSGFADRLMSAGLTPEGWQELMVQGGKKDEGSEPGRPPVHGIELPGGVGALAVLLSELDEMMNAAAITEQVVHEKTPQLSTQVDKLAEQTKQKIEDFDKSVKKGEELLDELTEPAKSRMKMSRRAMMELLAEIVQELCQSLSAINCAVGMTIAGHIGDINREQQEVLGVAAKCGQWMDELLDRLIEIVGLPQGLEPDKESVYSSPAPPRRRPASTAPVAQPTPVAPAPQPQPSAPHSKPSCPP